MGKQPIDQSSFVDSSLSDILMRLSRIKILVVADSIISLGPEKVPGNLDESFFGMSHLLGVLSHVGWVTKAHRSTDPLGAAGVIPDFKFDEHDLGKYDQIWMFGYSGPALSSPELGAVATFMNNGGGVFAVGDHASLGSSLCGAIPRVRSMRQWGADSPPATGAMRVDTTRPDVDDVVVFENQSDDIPQTLKLKMYQWRSTVFSRETYPHPVLCGSKGPIRHFPDHMHEGEVVEPSDLTAPLLPGAGSDEYPKDSNGQRIAPEVVAWGWTTGRADPEVMHGIHVGDDQTAVPRWTGTVCVYDGKRAGVGRVVVDSTFHHFFDINLIGDNAANRPGFSDPRAPLWRKGFTFSPEGQAVLAQIDQYYRNIVHWLSPGIGLYNSLDGLVVQLAADHRIREMVDGGVRSPAALGAYAWEYALRRAPPCTVIELIFEHLRQFIPLDPFPWQGPGPGDPGPDPWPISPGDIARVALGGALAAAAGLPNVAAVAEEAGLARVRAGMADAVHALVRDEAARAERGLRRLKDAEARLARRTAR